jgi:hypothetical protein
LNAVAINDGSGYAGASLVLLIESWRMRLPAAAHCVVQIAGTT